MTSDPEITPNVLVNNVGFFKVCSIFKETPENLQTMLKVNLYPITLLSKWGLINFKKQNNQCGLISVSSYSALRPYTRAGTYGGCKRFDAVFGSLIKKKNVDSLVLYPGLVTTSMVGNISNWYNTCMPQETANGTLCNLGLAKYTNGSLIHTIWAIQIAWTPEYIRNL